jgi:hypothetical protein
MLTADLPSGVLGPVDFWELRRLASNCLSVAIEFSLPTKPNWGPGPGFLRFVTNKANLADLFGIAVLFLANSYSYSHNSAAGGGN